MTWRRALGAAGAVLLLGAAGAWWWWSGLQREADASLTAVAAALPGLSSSGRADLAASAPAQCVPVSAAASAAGQPVDAVDEVWNICGLGPVSMRQVNAWSPLQKLKVEAQLQALDRRGQAHVTRISARLAAGSEAQQVAARLLMDDVEGAALVAARSADGPAYRLALNACKRHASAETAPSCAGLSATGWAQRDPLDARPWMLLLSEAAARRDEPAAEAALDQLLDRTLRSADRPLLLAAAAVGDEAPDDDAIGRGMAASTLVSKDVELAGHDFMGLAGYCGSEALKQPGRHARCERLVRWQFAQARTVQDALITTLTAQRVGLPVQEFPYTKDELKQAQDWVLRDPSQAVRVDCEGIAAAAAQPAALIVRQELQAALEAVRGQRQP